MSGNAEQLGGIKKLCGGRYLKRKLRSSTLRAWLDRTLASFRLSSRVSIACPMKHSDLEALESFVVEDIPGES